MCIHAYCVDSFERFPNNLVDAMLDHHLNVCSAGHGCGECGSVQVLDRFRVILDIFADRARTTEAKLQVGLLLLSATLCLSSISDRLVGRVGTGIVCMYVAGSKHVCVTCVFCRCFSTRQKR